MAAKHSEDQGIKMAVAQSFIAVGLLVIGFTHDIVSLINISSGMFLGIGTFTGYELFRSIIK